MNQSQSPAPSKGNQPKAYAALKRSSKDLSRMLRHFEKQYREQKTATTPTKNEK